MDKGEALALINEVLNTVEDKEVIKNMKKIEGYVLSSDEELLYTVKEVKEKLKTNVNYVNKLINNGYLPALKLGRVKVTKKALLEFLDMNTGMDVTDPANVVELNVKKQSNCCSGPNNSRTKVLSGFDKESKIYAQ